MSQGVAAPAARDSAELAERGAVSPGRVACESVACADS